MIERLQRIAIILHRLRPLIILLGILGLAGFILSAVNPTWWEGAAWLGPCGLLFCWCLTLYSVAGVFSRVPPRASPEMGWWQRCKINARRVVVWFLAILMVILTLTMVVLTYQMLRIWLT